MPPLPPLPGQQLSLAAYDGGFSSEVTRCASGAYHVRITCPTESPLVLHWGCNNWQLPPASCIPPSSQQAGDRAVRTPFEICSTGAAGAESPSAESPGAVSPEPVSPDHVSPGAVSAVTLSFPEEVCPERLVFVIHDTGADLWIRDHSANFSLPLRWEVLGRGLWGDTSRFKQVVRW